MTIQVVTRAMTIDGHVISVPVSDEVAAVINEWSRKHGEELNALLEPYGLGNYDIVQPDWHRIVAADVEPDASL